MTLEDDVLRTWLNHWLMITEHLNTNITDIHSGLGLGLGLGLGFSSILPTHDARG